MSLGLNIKICQIVIFFKIFYIIAKIDNFPSTISKDQNPKSHYNKSKKAPHETHTQTLIHPRDTRTHL